MLGLVVHAWCITMATDAMATNVTSNALWELPTATATATWSHNYVATMSAL